MRRRHGFDLGWISREERAGLGRLRERGGNGPPGTEAGDAALLGFTREEKEMGRGETRTNGPNDR